VRSSSLVCHALETDPAVFSRLIHRFVYEARQVVFYEGHPCLGLYVLCAGRVKLTSSSPTGHRRIIRLVSAGELIERAGFCAGMAHDATCETLEPSQVCLIDRQGYLGLLEKTPKLAVELLQLASRGPGPARLSDDRFAFCRAPERFATLLLDLGKRFGRQTPDGIVIGVRLSREELAELVGAAPETVIRLLSRFKRERLVATNGSEITLLKPERLGKIAGPSSDPPT
jgi:CRP/FNR family transcriptional regulator